MDPVIVVGAGISGVTCANVLASAGVPVVVLDRGRAAGGRMASHTVAGRTVDVGASYFTATDARFVEQVERWQHAGLARPWTDTFLALAPGEPAEVKAGPVRWGTPGGLRSLVEDRARGLDVQRLTVERVVRDQTGALRVAGRPAAAVVLAMPDPQARRLVGPDLSEVARALDQDYDPVLALTTVWDARAWDLDGAFVKGDESIEWLADDGRRRDDDAPVLVAHSTPALAREHLRDPEAAAPRMLDALRDLLDLTTEPVHLQAHRWTFAKPVGTHPTTYLLTEDLVGACGDSWTEVPKVEGAFLSGLELGEALVRRLRP